MFSTFPPTPENKPRMPQVAWTPFEASTQPMGSLDRSNSDNNRSDIEAYIPLTYRMTGVLPSIAEGHWEEGVWTGHKYIIQVQAEVLFSPRT